MNIRTQKTTTKTEERYEMLQESEREQSVAKFKTKNSK
jgi:hypothetical protein